MTNEELDKDLENITDIVGDKTIMYASREAGIKSFAETYSFNIESILFNQLTLEQQELWRKEIENAVISGGEMGLALADDKRYEERVSSEERINECLNWNKDWGCSTSPMNKCDTCLHAKWVEVKEEKKNYNERYKRFAQTEQFKKSYCDKSLGKEEPVSEDLEEEIKHYIQSEFPDGTGFPNVPKIARHFAEWQKQKDQETIELAEDHAMLAGMNKMKEEMMENAVYGCFIMP